ncbi:uracil-DNA glycosylase [Arcobacter caeni]|uniref:Uracil-DNA glycosylase n=1 Tax=Arcobacter caeni TaxID=1912877 RepID=A0A363D1F3_9BACT|nr:uracil-DNA glycosylase [Arcobacter caeni]PUE65121.1 uracil-DNA glycosylase [Arcobacter caeni]
MEKRIACQKCVYYFVTWEAGKPHGCKAYGFKSQLIPSISVKRASGEDCKLFSLKNIKQ